MTTIDNEGQFPFKFSVTLHGDVVRGHEGDIEDHLDSVMAELEHLRAADPTIDLDLKMGTVDLSVVVDAANPLDAVAQASGFIRTAIHAVGGSTPDWPQPVDDVWGIRLLAVRSALLSDPSRPELVTSWAQA